VRVALRRQPPPLSGEHHADPSFLAPNNVAVLAGVAGWEIQCDFVWDAYGTRNFESRSSRGYVANCAVDSAAVELDGSRLVNPLALYCTSFIHRDGLTPNPKNPANRHIKTSGLQEQIGNQNNACAEPGPALALCYEPMTAI
jgi:hypothetical protein